MLDHVSKGFAYADALSGLCRNDGQKLALESETITNFFGMESTRYILFVGLQDDGASLKSQAFHLIQHFMPKG